jgi:hypothetical protein
MLGSWPPEDFPRLTKNTCKITSDATYGYNCIAYANYDEERWWDPHPDYYWPDTLPRSNELETIMQLFSNCGYISCADGEAESGYAKIALYAQAIAIGGQAMTTHVARQQPNGKWTSKISQYEDIEHKTADVLEGTKFGRVMCYMKRPL